MGPEPPFEVPIFVSTHRPRPEDARKGTTFTFLDSFDAALAAAREAAAEKDVALHGGSMIRQALAAGVLHELNLQWRRSCSAGVDGSSPLTRARRARSSSYAPPRPRAPSPAATGSETELRRRSHQAQPTITAPA